MKQIQIVLDFGKIVLLNLLNITIESFEFYQYQKLLLCKSLSKTAL